MHRLLPLLLLLVASTAHAQQEYSGLVEELRAIHPDAARHLSAGLEAWAEDPALAEGLLSQAIDKAPGFAPIARVGCELALERGARSRAIHWCRRANTTAESPETLRTLALALATPVLGMEPTPDELAEAAKLAVRASLLAPGDVVAARSLCEVALYADDGPRLQTCVTRLQQLDPEGMPTRYFVAHLDAARGNLWAARRGLDEARGAGLSDALYDDARRTFRQRRSLGLAHAEALGMLLLVWLLLVGISLVAAAGSGAAVVGIEDTGGLSPALRRHRAALRLLALMGGASVFVVLAVVVGAGVGIVRQLVMQPLPAWEVAVGVASTVVLLYGLFLHLVLPQARPVAVDLGFPIDLTAYPKLSALVDRARTAVQAPEPDRVLLVPGCQLEVAADAGGFEQFVGHPERHLWIGVASLSTLSAAQLEALLAREFARSAREDGSLRLRRLLPLGLDARAHLSTARPWNPWWVGFGRAQRTWSTLSMPWASFVDRRLDSAAATATHPDAVAGGLERLDLAQGAWTARVAAVRGELLDPAASVRNLYVAPAPKRSAPPTSPSLVPRLAALRAGIDPAETPIVGASAWSLIEGREGVEQEMTRLLRRLLREESLRTGRLPSTR